MESSDQRAKKLTFHDGCTFRERIASVALVADTYGIVFHDVAVGVHAARARARIYALFVLTRQVAGTSLIDDTLGTTVRRAAYVIR